MNQHTPDTTLRDQRPTKPDFEVGIGEGWGFVEQGEPQNHPLPPMKEKTS